MKQIVLTCMIILWGMTVKSQEKMSYQLKGQLIEFSISQNEIYIRFDKDQKVVIEKQFRQNFIGLNANSALIAVKNLTGSFRQKKQILQDNIPIKFKKVEPVLIYEDGIREIATGELNIKVKQNGSLDKILKGVKYSSQQNQFDEKLYLIKTDLSTSELFRLVNRLQSSDQAEFIEPNFIRLIKPYTNDQFYSYQWSINNQGYLGGDSRC